MFKPRREPMVERSESATLSSLRDSGIPSSQHDSETAFSPNIQEVDSLRSEGRRRDTDARAAQLVLDIQGTVLAHPAQYTG